MTAVQILTYALLAGTALLFVIGPRVARRNRRALIRAIANDHSNGRPVVATETTPPEVTP